LNRCRNPGLFARVSLGASTLQIDSEGEQPASPPPRHGSDDFAGVAVGIPFAGIRVSPACRSFRILIVKYALHHACIEQQAFDFLALKSAGFGKLAFSLTRSVPDRTEHLAVPVYFEDLAILTGGHPELVMRVHIEGANEISHLNCLMNLPFAS